MANIKTYTDIKQSKKLAKILPIESADMYYATWTILDGEFIVSPNQGSTIESLQEDYGNQIIPCWSLAALLDVLPKIYGLKPMFDLEECSIQYSGIDIYIIASNHVDVCYDTILKLHEQNLI